MEDPPSKRRVENQALEGPVQARLGIVRATHGTFQPPFSLTEADFLRLKSSSPTWTAVGAAVTSFGVASLLPLIARELMRTAPPVTDVEWWIAGSTVLLGAVLLGMGTLLSKEKRAILKRIDTHFRENPSQLEYREDVR